MASKRHLRHKACDGKIRYEQRETAEQAAQSLAQYKHQWINAYHCRFCKGWHIGHPNARARQSMIAKRQGQFH